MESLLVKFSEPTENPIYTRLITVIIDKSKAWNYEFCNPHADEFIKLSREAGDTFVYYKFMIASDNGFCPICYAKKKGLSYHTFPQISYEVDSPK